MKKILFFLSLFVSGIAYGQNTHLNPINQGGNTSQGAIYYVSSGADTTQGSGSIPSKPISFYRLLSFAPNFVGAEKIYFKSNGTYYGDLTVQPGSYIGKYGAGARPIINGTILSTSLTWTQNGVIWSAPMASRINNVFLNNVQQRCAQSASYYTITTKASSTSITSTGATGLGAWAAHCEIVGKEFDFRPFWDSTSAYNSGTGNFTLTYGNGSTVNEKFKLINNENLIVADGDWAWRSGTIYYRSPGNVNPNTLNVSLAFYNEGIHIANNSSNVKIENISFFGQNYEGIYGDSVNNVTINNVDCKGQFNSGIALVARCEGLVMSNVQVDSTGNHGVFCNSLFDANVTRSKYTNIGTQGALPINRWAVLGTGSAGSRYYFPATYGTGFHTDPNSGRNYFEYDSAINTAYNGFFLNGNPNTTVTRCLIHDFCTRMNDGGAINTFADSAAYFAVFGWRNVYNLTVSNNLIYNGIGNNEGGVSENPLAFGVYFDVGTFYSSIIGNTVFNCSAGALISAGTNRVVRGNTFYNNVEQMRVINWPAGVLGGDGPLTNGDTVENNIFVSGNTTQYAIQFFDYGSGGFIESGASFKNNTIISPYTNNVIAKTVNASTVTNYTLAGATTYYGFTFGQQDLYTASYVDNPTFLANIPIDVNWTPFTRQSIVPLNFHNPLNRNYDPLIGPYGSAVYITGAFSGVGTTIYSGDGTLSGNRTISMAGNSLTMSSTGNAVSILQSGTTATNANSEVLNSGTNGLQNIAWGSAATTNGIASANDGTLRYNGVAGKSLTLENLFTGNIKFGINSVQVGIFDGTKFGVTGNFTVSGTSTLSDNLSVAKNQNAITSATVSNTTAGATSNARGTFTSDVNSSIVLQYSSTTTAYGGFRPSSGGLYTTSGHLNLMADSLNSEVDVMVGSSGSAVDYIFNNTSFNPAVNVANDLGTASLGWREGFFGAGTASVAQMNFTAGTKKTSMADGDLTHTSGHLYFHDGSTDYDLLASATDGTYTPSATSVTNSSTTTPALCHYTRVGNHVTVFGNIGLAATSGGSNVSLDLSLPVASTITGGTDIYGTGNAAGSAVASRVYIQSTNGDNNATLTVTAPGTTSLTGYNFSFMYIVH